MHDYGIQCVMEGSILAGFSDDSKVLLTNFTSLEREYHQ
jgi:hypothetical protein